jgi:hypothetical protein
MIRGTLIATFLAVILADLCECRPFSHNWQVLPDPGPQCRQGSSQLLTMAVCNVFTDLLLIIFPIPVIVSSSMSIKRKTQLIMLFSLSLAPVTVTIYRVPHILADHGDQSTRSLYASVEILFATVAANALVLGSFVRDRGVKKKKFKYGSIAAGSMERSSGSESRRPTATKHWGSLEDLARDTGYGVHPELRETDPALDGTNYTPAPLSTLSDGMNSWNFPRQNRGSGRSDESLMEEGNRPNSAATPRKVAFFDVGGLLDDQPNSRRGSNISSVDPVSPHSIPPPAIPASGSGFRRGSTAFLQDIGGLLSPSSLLSPVSGTRRESRAKSVAELQPVRRPGQDSRDSHGRSELVLMDAGGLLS